MYLFYFFFLIFFPSLYGQTHFIHNQNTRHKIYCNSLTNYLLPHDHHLQTILKNIFQHPEMFQTPSHFRNAGFNVELGHRKLMVGFHPAIAGYLIKKFSHDIPLSTQLNNYIKRIKGAKRLCEYIKKYNFQHLVVPQKWLYRLPKSFSMNQQNAYVLIVENMDIYNDWENPKGEARNLYFNMDKEILPNSAQYCMKAEAAMLFQKSTLHKVW